MIIKSCIERATGDPAAYVLFDTTEDGKIADIIDPIKNWLGEEYIDEPTVGFGVMKAREAREKHNGQRWHWWMVFNDWGRAVDLKQGQYLVKLKNNQFWAYSEEEFKERFRIDY